LKPLKPGAVIFRHDSESQLRGASMRMRWPSISNEMPPACTEVEAINSAARMKILCKRRGGAR